MGRALGRPAAGAAGEAARAKGAGGWAVGGGRAFLDDAAFEPGLGALAASSSCRGHRGGRATGMPAAL